MKSGVGEGAEKEEETPERKLPSKDASLRWGVVSVYLIVTVPLMFAIIVMVALP